VRTFLIALPLLLACSGQKSGWRLEELRDSLEKDSEVIERVHDRLMDCLMEFSLKILKDLKTMEFLWFHR